MFTAPLGPGYSNMTTLTMHALLQPCGAPAARASRPGHHVGHRDGRCKSTCVDRQGVDALYVVYQVTGTYGTTRR